MAIPVAHTLMGKGALPDDDPLTLGMTGFWGTKFVNDKCLGADWVLGLGTRFAEADCSSWDPEFTFSFPPSKLIHIDIDPNEIGRNFPAAIGVVTDLKQALIALNRVARRLLPEGSQQRRARRGDPGLPRRIHASNREHVKDPGFPMRPERILAAVREALPRDAIITTDVGWNKNGVGQQFPVYTPGSILTPGGYATMGFGAPAAIGAKLACPDRVVLALVGDGGFGQNPSMLATAAEQGVAVIWVVMNNFAYGTIAGLQMAHYGTTIGCVFRKDGEPYSPDFAAIARAYGVEGVQIKSADEFKPALERAIGSGQALRDRCGDAERAGADRRPLEHQRHLFAGTGGLARRRRLGSRLDPMKLYVLDEPFAPGAGSAAAAPGPRPRRPAWRPIALAALVLGAVAAYLAGVMPFGERRRCVATEPKQRRGGAAARDRARACAARHAGAGRHERGRRAGAGERAAGRGEQRGAAQRQVLHRAACRRAGHRAGDAEQGHGRDRAGRRRAAAACRAGHRERDRALAGGGVAIGLRRRRQLRHRLRRQQGLRRSLRRRSLARDEPGGDLAAADEQRHRRRGPAATAAPSPGATVYPEEN